MQDLDPDASPINPLPPILAALGVAMGLIEIAFQLGARGLVGGREAIGWRVQGIESFGFFDSAWEQALISQSWPIDTLQRFLTYPFVHQNATHAIFAIALLLAIGNFSGRIFSGWALAIVFALSSAAGAVAFGLFNSGLPPLYGAYPPVYGFLGLMTWALWIIARREGKNPLRAFQLVGILVALQLAFYLLFGASLTLASELTGFATGFLLAPFLVPGGLRRILEMIRAR